MGEKPTGADEEERKKAKPTNINRKAAPGGGKPGGDEGTADIEVGFAPLKPAEFVVVKSGQRVTGNA